MNVAEYRPAIIKGDIALLPLGIGAKDGYAIIDAEYRHLDIHPWYLLKIGYPGTNVKCKKVLLHNMLMPDGRVDHIDRNKLNNRMSNLRYCTQQQNNCNKGISKSNSTGFRGVYKPKNKDIYHVSIWKDGKRYFLGCFKNPKEAALCYNEKALELFGEFASLNNVN